MSNMEIGFFAEKVPVNFVFAGKKVSFDEQLLRYAAAVAAFAPKAEQAICKMERNFDSDIGYLDNFLAEGGAWFYKTMSDLLDFSIEQLSLNGCFSSEKETFFKQYVAAKMEVTPRIYEKMKAVYDDIHEQQAKKNAERVAERKFNVANGSDELGEMLLNGVARSWDGGKNILRATKEYNEDVQEKIKQEFRYICRTMVDSFANALWDSEHIDLRDPVPVEDYKRTFAMFENLKANKIPETKIDDVALEIFGRNPIVPGFLDWAVARYGDADGEMQKIADAFHISIDATKKSFLKQVFDGLDFSSEQATVASKEKLLAAEDEIGFHDDEYHAVIENHLTEFDRLARTVEGIEYETREEAENVSKLFELFQTLSFETEAETLKSREIFLAKEQELGTKLPECEEKISSVLATMEQNAKTFDGQEFATMEEAAEAKKQYDELKKMIIDNGFDTIEKVQALLAEIEKSNFSIPQAAKVKERLAIHLEILKSYPINHLNFFKIMMYPKIKLISVAILLALFVISSNIIPTLGFLIMIIYLAYLASLFFTTKTGLLKLAKTFEDLKKYKFAALCYELAKPETDPKYLGIEL